MDQTPMRSLTAESCNQYVEVVRRQIKFNTPFRPQIYSHSSFPNVRYIPNHSEYYILFFRVSLNLPNYRMFSNFQSRPSTGIKFKYRNVNLELYRNITYLLKNQIYIVLLMNLPYPFQFNDRRPQTFPGRCYPLFGLFIRPNYR